MAIQYTYLGIEDGWHKWDASENSETYRYVRHVDDEPVRQSLVQKYQELGFTNQEIQMIIGPEIIFGLENFSIRDNYNSLD